MFTGMQAARIRRSRPAASAMEGKGWAGEHYFLVCPPHFCLPEPLGTEWAGCKREHEMLQ